jgi:cytochrome c-type biogenesis protein CcmH
MTKVASFRAACIVAALLSILLVPSAFGQTPTPNEINAIARQLWCPLCNGVRLDNCELLACDQMREVIAEKLAAGESAEQIRAYFVEQYGDVVLGAPAAEGFDSLAWLLPVILGIGGLAWLGYYVSRLVRRGAGTLAAGAGTAAGQPEQSDDPYLRRVDEELESYR